MPDQELTVELNDKPAPEEVKNHFNTNGIKR